MRLNLAKLKKETLEIPEALTKGMQYVDYKLLEYNLDAFVGTRFIFDVNFSYKKSGFVRLTTVQTKNDEELAEAAKRVCKSIKKFFDIYLTDEKPYLVVLEFI